MSKIEIEIPVGKEVDWEASAKQKQIVLKDKQLTYEDICEKIFKDDYWFIGSFGNINSSKLRLGIYNINNASSEHQLKYLLAKNKLANVARYLNGNWTPGKTDHGYFDAYVLYATPNKDYIGYIKISDCAHNSNVLFKSDELARQAIKILGEETIKLALEPLY